MVTSCNGRSVEGARVLILGYGNPGRQDDGLGPALVAQIDRLGWPHLTAHDPYQLNIEDAIDVAEADIVWFVDAMKAGTDPYTIRNVAAAFTMDFTSHLVRPETILALAQEYYGKSPEAFLLGIRGYQFEFVEELTIEAAENLRLALTMLVGRLGVEGGPPWT